MENQNYNYAIVRSFVTWSVIWGFVAILVGVILFLLYSTFNADETEESMDPDAEPTTA